MVAVLTSENLHRDPHRWVPVRWVQTGDKLLLLWEDSPQLPRRGLFDQRAWSADVSRYAVSTPHLLLEIRPQVSVGACRLLKHCGRCGSTLLSNLIGNLSQVVSIAEPAFITVDWGALASAYGLHRSDVEQIQLTLIGLACRDIKRDAAVCLLKPPSFADMLSIIAIDCPAVFLFRAPHAVISSMVARQGGALDALSARASSLPPDLRRELAGKARGGYAEAIYLRHILEHATSQRGIKIDYADLIAALSTRLNEGSAVLAALSTWLGVEWMVPFEKVESELRFDAYVPSHQVRYQQSAKLDDSYPPSVPSGLRRELDDIYGILRSQAQQQLRG